MTAISFLESIKIVGAACGAIVTIIGFLGLISKKPKQWLANTIKEANREEFEKVHEFIEDTKKTKIITLRHDITLIYEKYRQDKKIPSKLKENTCSLYEEYASLGGNSYVHNIFEEMLEWEEI